MSMQNKPRGRGGDDHSRVVAVLGPTNTGKTYLAIERMLGHASGMIGFPLRLLARENYEKVAAAKGKNAVALVTGEEKIIPKGARYWVCTVESMPVDRAVEFLAVDEIQLCADPDRGHLFTDRLLHARGTVETMFLGSEIIQPILRKLVPKAEFVSRPRFSKLTYAGYKKLTRLAPRSAVVAFSAADVYAIAELIRHQRGGAAVVLGALSPRTRNAQVELYQSGDVDYLVATDAVGMGLNMDVDHVAFARIIKFDGMAPRRLLPTEVAQIAGRAGRHTRDGTFGITDQVDELHPDLIERVEEHQFDSLKAVMWRNSDLRFDSVGFLLKSLEERSTVPELIRVREADDHLALQALARDEEVAALAKGRAAVRLLWDVCGVPDFRKILSDAHTRLLGQMYRFLARPAGRLPVDWVGKQVTALDRVDGDIDTLVARIAHVRTWTYIAHCPDWLAAPTEWQEKTRAIEDRLSDALHERLTQRFVDRRSATLVRTLQTGKALEGGVRADGEVVVEGHPVGRLSGFRFVADAPARSEEARALFAAARRALKSELARRLTAAEAAPDEAFAFNAEGNFVWEGAVLGRIAAGPGLLTPTVQPDPESLLEAAHNDRLKARLERRLTGQIARDLAPLLTLVEADLPAGPARGLAFQLAEAGGLLERAAVAAEIDALTGDGRTALWKLGVRLGLRHIYLPALMKPAAVAMAGMLWAARRGAKFPVPLPAAGRVSFIADPAWPADYWAALGYPLAGPRAVRADMLERFERLVLDKAAPAASARLLALPVGELDGVLEGLGYVRHVGEDGAAAWRMGRATQRRPIKDRKPAKPLSPDHPFAALAQLQRKP
jgi:ATP-dependent RNA helicase SUPV3L1/SUV3